MEVTARLNNLRIGPRKVRLVAGLVRGQSLTAALAELEFLTKRAARPLHKLLRAAAADAEHNFKLAKDDLFVKRIVVNGGVTMKRSTPRAFGRAAPIRKRGSHVIVTLESRTGATAASAPAAGPAAPSVVAPSDGQAKKAAAKAGSLPAPKLAPRGLGRRYFSRKTG